MTRVIADTHLHLYPCHDAPAAIGALAGNLARLGDGIRAGFFAERRGCRAFTALREGALALPAGRRVLPLREPETALLVRDHEPPVHLFAGRQIVTAERIEVLALAVDVSLPDGLPAVEVVDAVLAAGGVPVIGWSPGKWLFARGALVRELLRQRQPGEILLGDTALRPEGTREPRLMREARRLGFGVVAGTDPLPFPGDERTLGTYATAWEADFDPDSPLASVRRMLRSPGLAVGARGSWGVAARRWLRATLAGRA